MLDRKEALRLLGIPADVQHLTTAQLRKYYLKAALVHHPDKNRTLENASEKFASLQEAYSLLLSYNSTKNELARQRVETDQLLNLFYRAMQGENVEQELKEMGEYRPSEMFGINLSVPFAQSTSQQCRCTAQDNIDLHQAFADVFADQGLDAEGNPLDGWARPPQVDLEDL